MAGVAGVAAGFTHFQDVLPVFLFVTCVGTLGGLHLSVAGGVLESVVAAGAAAPAAGVSAA